MTPSPTRSPWIVILAAGDGRRLQALTRDAAGRPVPKQYCSLAGGRSLLRSALDRAHRLAPRERIVTVVARDHRRWWETELRQQPRENVIVQPRNRGTAAGVLLPLRSILARDPDAVLGVLPSDHFIADERRFASALGRALRAAEEEEPGPLVLLGMEAERPETDLGWIVPGASRSDVRGVAAFVEKPPRDEAAGLMSRGALWNSFAFAGRARVLHAALHRCLPELAMSFESIHSESASESALSALYETLPEADFSRSVLGALADALRVVAVPPCGWMDLGTPERLARCLAGPLAAAERAGAGRAPVSLAALEHRGGGAPLAAPA